MLDGIYTQLLPDASAGAQPAAAQPAIQPQPQAEGVAMTVAADTIPPARP